MDIVITRQIASTPERVWQIVGDFAAMEQWSAPTESCRISGSGIGAQREISAMGARVRQTLLECDDASRTILWSMTDTPAFPWCDYTSRLQVMGDPAGARVVWTCHLVPLAGEALVQGLVERSYGPSLDKLTRLLAA